MTPHLDDVELVDAVDGLLAPSRAAHLQTCGTCSERLHSLRNAISGLQETDPAAVPEPSPLFWEHFSRRVHDAVRESGTPGHANHWWRPARIAALGAAAAIVIAGATTVMLKQAPASDGRRVVTVSAGEEAPSASAQTPAGALDVESDPDWALVRAVADDLPWEDATEAGIHARPGSADRVAVEMSPAERQELTRLLEDELKRTGV